MTYQLLFFSFFILDDEYDMQFKKFYFIKSQQVTLFSLFH
jgi:hypothetical protein